MFESEKRFPKPAHVLIIAATCLLFLATVTQAAYIRSSGRSGSRIPLIGRDLNGVDLNGTILDGSKVVSVSLHNVQLDGQTLSSVRLDRTVFHGLTQDGKTVNRRRFLGGVFEASLDDGRTLEFRIEDIQMVRERGHRNMYHYLVTYRTEAEWEPLCGRDEQGRPVHAIPLNGRWNLEEGVPGGGAHSEDAGVFTFACEEYVVAKCLMAGYKPWILVHICERGSGCETITLAGHHQACTRLLRADFCGDGTSYTQDGVWVNMYDGLGIRVDEDDWVFEAEWNAGGANCMSASRLPLLVPPCTEHLAAEGCGDPEHLQHGSLLFSETESDGP